MQKGPEVLSLVRGSVDRGVPLRSRHNKSNPTSFGKCRGRLLWPSWC